MATWTMYYLESSGVLYRGFGHAHPAVSWSPEVGSWAPNRSRLPLSEPLQVRLTEAEAERSYPGSTISPYPADVKVEREVTFEEMVQFRPENFENDFSFPTRRTPEEQERAAAYSAAIRPEWVTNAILKRQWQAAASKLALPQDPTAGD